MSVDLKNTTTQPNSNPIGRFCSGSIDLEGLDEPVDWDQLFQQPKDFWNTEAADIEKYFTDQFNEDLPDEMLQEIQALKKRINRTD